MSPLLSGILLIAFLYTRHGQAVGVAATKCDPRNTISQSGILPELARWMHAAPGILTPSHVEFLQCCILAGQYRYARRAVATDWPRPMKGMPVSQTLRYYYLRGLVHMGCEEWQWAVRSFWTCLSIPSDGISAIVIVAWKRLVLCQCLLGSPTSLPPTASPAVTRFFTTREGESQNILVYRDLIKAVQVNDRARFLSLQQMHAAVWEADHNTGMVKRLATEVLHRCVRHLASVYSVISLQQLGDELQIPTVEVPLLLSQVSGLVANLDPDGMFSLELAEMDIISSEGLAEIMELADRIRALDISIATSTRYQHLKDSSTRVPFPGPLGVAEL